MHQELIRNAPVRTACGHVITRDWKQRGGDADLVTKVHDRGPDAWQMEVVYDHIATW